jgi:hypothetical protein
MGGNGIRSKNVSNMIIRECILCGLVYLAPARCAHEKIVRTVGEIRNLINLIAKDKDYMVLRNQLPPLLRRQLLATRKTLHSVNKYILSRNINYF